MMVSRYPRQLLRYKERGLVNIYGCMPPLPFDGHMVEQPQNRFSGAHRMKSSSASLEEFSVPARLRSTVKSSILNGLTTENSKAWSVPPVNLKAEDSFVSHLHDPLDDLYVRSPTQYWPDLPANVSPNADPFLLSRAEVDDLSRSIREDLLGTDHPVLNKAAAYFFADNDGGKKVRPMMVMLLSRALSNTLDASGERDDNALLSDPMPWQRQDLPEAQRRLAEITEMIHTASLFHDDVIDSADTRRGEPAVHMVFGNKMAILAGDYLLARASVCLARLRNVDVVEAMSTTIEHLVRGEVMQMRGTSSKEGENERMVYYLKKNYYKTASLMANSCLSTALLAGSPSELVTASYLYGKHVGMAFQLVDDVLDFEGSVSSLGKPALADLKAGLATAPVLFAAETNVELETLMDRKFREDGDVGHARKLVVNSDGIQKTKELARVHAELAMEAVLELDNSLHRDALINLAFKVVSRTK